MQFVYISSFNPPENPRRKDQQHLDFADGKAKAKQLVWGHPARSPLSWDWRLSRLGASLNLNHEMESEMSLTLLPEGSILDRRLLGFLPSPSLVPNLWDVNMPSIHWFAWTMAWTVKSYVYQTMYNNGTIGIIWCRVAKIVCITSLLHYDLKL